MESMLSPPQKDRLSRDRPPSVPLADPGADIAPIRDEVLFEISRVIDGGDFILGTFVDDFELAFAARLGARAAVGVASGTDGLALTLQALGVGLHDEVITVSHTAGATVAAIRMVGAVPVLVDIEPRTYCLDPAKLEEAHGPRTKAIIAVHLYGHSADMAAIMEFSRRHGIPVVEDCAQAQEATFHRAPAGTMGAAGCFSFYPTKILGAIGDAGAIASNDASLAERVRSLRTYGWAKPQFATLPGGRSSRLDAMQAAILSVRLRYVRQQVERRRAIAEEYGKAFADLPIQLPHEHAGCRHVYHLYVIRTDQRDGLRAHLERDGITTAIHYPFPVHAQPGLAQGARICAPLTVTDRVVREILTLPLFPTLTADGQARVIDSVRSYFGKA